MGDTALSETLRSIAAVGVTIALVTVTFPPAVTGGDDGTQTIGTYVRLGTTGELTEDDVEPTPNGFVVDAPTGTDEIRVDRAYVRDRLGAWGADHAFTLDSDRVVAQAEDVTFTSFQPNATPTYTLGSRDSIRFAERPMWLSVDSHDDGSFNLTADAEDTTGQAVRVNASWLWDRGIYAPRVTHEDGSNVPVAWVEGGAAYRADVPHFSEVKWEITGADVSPELDVKIRVDGVLSDHTGDETWDKENQTLYIDIGDYLTEIDVLVEREWVDNHIDYLAVWRRNFTYETIDGTEYYVSTLPADETPTLHVLREYQASNKSMFTRGSPHSIKLWAVNETAFTKLALMNITYDDTGTPELDLNRTGEYLLQFNHSWLSQQGINHPEFISDGNVTNYFQMANGTDWIVPQWGNGTVLIENRTNATTDPTGVVEYVSNGTLPNITSEGFEFGPESYDPLTVFKNGTDLTDFEPPARIQINGSGVIGKHFHPATYPDVGLGMDYMPVDTNESYRLGVWLGTADLASIHATLAQNYTSINQNRTTSAVYRFQYGIPRLSMPGSEAMWDMYENNSYLLDNPYVSGPVKNRTFVPLTRLAGGLSLCKVKGNCSDTRDLEFQVKEDGIRNKDLESIVAKPLSNVTRCLENSTACPCRKRPW